MQLFTQDKKFDIKSQLIRIKIIFTFLKKKSLKKKIVIHFLCFLMPEYSCSSE